MGIYTKCGDEGKTSLMNIKNIAKTDDRIELLGTIDELSSAIGLAKAASDAALKEYLSHIQKELMQLMAGIADFKNPQYRLNETEVTTLEQEIDRLETAFPRAKEFVLYGGSELSARLDMARAIARRAERRFHKVARSYGADHTAMHYLNRLSDYLYIAARYSDYIADTK